MGIKEILEHSDKLYEEGKYDEAAAYQEECLKQAEIDGDWVVQLGLYNDLEGVYRNRSDFENAWRCSKNSMRLIKEHGLEGTIQAATTYLNTANVYRATGQPEEAEKLYLEVERIYLAHEDIDPWYLGGVYNNLCVVNLDMKNFEKGIRYGEMGIDYLSKVPGGEGQVALGYANLAGAAMAGEKPDPDRAREFLKKGAEIFETKAPDDAGYGVMLGNLAALEERAGNHAAALENYERAMEIIKLHYGENKEYKRMTERCRMIREKM